MLGKLTSPAGVQSRMRALRPVAAALQRSLLVDRVGKRLTRDEECDRIIEAHGPADFAGISEALDRQFRTIHNRAQLLLGICGVLISASVLVTTGRLIGGQANFQ